MLAFDRTLALVDPALQTVNEAEAFDCVDPFSGDEAVFRRHLISRAGRSDVSKQITSLAEGEGWSVSSDTVAKSRFVRSVNGYKVQVGVLYKSAAPGSVVTVTGTIDYEFCPE